MDKNIHESEVEAKERRREELFRRLEEIEQLYKPTFNKTMAELNRKINELQDGKNKRNN